MNRSPTLMRFRTDTGGQVPEVGGTRHRTPIRPPRIHGPMSLLPDQPRSVQRLVNAGVVSIRFVRQCLDHADVMRKRRRDDHPNRRTELRCRLPRTHRGLVALVGLLSQCHNGELLRWTGDAARTALLDKAAPRPRRPRRVAQPVRLATPRAQPIRRRATITREWNLGSTKSSRVTAPPSRPPVSTTPAAHPGSPAGQLHYSRYPPAGLIAPQPQGQRPGPLLDHDTFDLIERDASAVRA